MNRDSRRGSGFLSVALRLSLVLLPAVVGAQQGYPPLYGAPTLNHRNPDANRLGEQGRGGDDQAYGNDQGNSGDADDRDGQQGFRDNANDQNSATGNVAENPFGTSPGVNQVSPGMWGSGAEAEDPEAGAQDDHPQRDWSQPPGTYADEGVQ